ncbi:hypothetical protein BCU13_013120 [Vibrio lentus]|uniref:hypothetical protein n=1 Tax=Vibrio lentus TaxID=136468 RepID=UPI000C842D3A|nr:hypothetical protein [Vibrio lentus]PMJ82945.1 hypothetical protein BCU13_19425 [Vibrio lentus]
MNSYNKWDVKYKGCSVYGYIVANAKDKRVTSFKPKYRLYFSDIKGLFRLFIVPFMDNSKVIVCSPDRADLDLFISDYFVNEEVIRFTRREIESGDTFLIDAVRKMFRVVLSVVLKRKEKEIAGKFGFLDNKTIEKDINSFLGDYYFNYVLSFFFKNKKVYYTNCVVPKVEKYMGLMNSVEIQHGVVYKGHFDYCDIDKRSLYGGFLAWNEYWKGVVENECHYSVDVVCGSYNGEVVQTDIKDTRTLVLSTVHDQFSMMIMSYFNHENVVLRKHPRDYFNYKDRGFIGEIENYTPLVNYNKIVCSDTTIIKVLVESKLFFYYLMISDESELEVENRIIKKYQAVRGVDYQIYKNEVCYESD